MANGEYNRNNGAAQTSAERDHLRLVPDAGATKKQQESSPDVDVVMPNPRGDKIVDNNDLLIKHIESIADNINKSHTELREEFRERDHRITDNQDKLEGRIDRKLDNLSVELKEREDRTDKKIDDLVKEFKSAKGWVIGICIATLLAIAALVVSVFAIVGQFLAS